MPVKGEAPGIAQTIGPDFAVIAFDLGERVCGRYGVRFNARLDIDTKYLAQEFAEVLPSIVRIVERGSSTIAAADVEVTVIGTEEETSTIVRYVGLVDLQNVFPTRRISQVRVGRSSVAADDSMAILIGIADIKMLFGAIFWWKGNVIQAAFSATAHLL